MKKCFPVLFTALAIIASAVCAWGEASPVIVTHNLTGYSKTEKAVTLEYTVQVRNQDNAALGALSLSFVPHPPFTKGTGMVTMETLAPNATATSTLKLVSPLLRDRKFFANMPLPWAGKYTSSSGKVVEFPVTSRNGGAK